ncbi:MAG: DUF1887 family CARF protein, partial [Syntrophales bacterium]|nr:DUF1887 family CARF protein [Syntrophales bacterium]
MKTLVSLCSDQTIPNVLGILHFRPDALLFVSTPAMEHKGVVHDILATVQRRLPHRYRLYENAHVVEVHENDILDCQRKLEGWITTQPEGEFIVNLTGGTKLMSIAAFDFFSAYVSRMIYLPIKGNYYLIPFPKKAPRAPTAITERLGVADYLTAYGIQVVNEKKLPEYAEAARKRRDIAAFIAREYDHLQNVLSVLFHHLRHKRDAKKPFDFFLDYQPADDMEKLFFGKVGFTEAHGRLHKNLDRYEIAFLTGGWLEDHCFNVIDALRGKG